MSNKLTVAPSPHIKDNATTRSVMLTVIMAMVPAIIASLCVFVFDAAILLVTCVVSCVAFEYLYNKINNKPQTIGDLSAVVTGIILAFNLPSTLPPWMAVVGCAAAIMVAKQLFGGIGSNFANPAIVGRIVLLVSFSGPMTNFLVVKAVDGINYLVAGATPLAINAGAQGDMPSMLNMFIGMTGGSLGETSALALLLGGLFLIWKKIITPTIPVAYLGTIAVFALLCGEDPLFHILAGGAMLAAFFMLTDYSTSPVTEKGKLIYGIGAGIITMVIRLFGSYPEGASFAILLMNILTPHIDNLTMTKPFGGAK